jgi:4-hydroxybenzoate polyprenyltransferase
LHLLIPPHTLNLLKASGPSGTSFRTYGTLVTQMDLKTSKTKAPSQKNVKSNELWGGNHQKGWVVYVPSACIPYIQLTRLYNPAPVMLVYFPHLFGLLYVAIFQRSPFREVFRSAIVLLGGSFFFSNALHVWDDIIDAPIDVLIERTRYRPIPRKAVTSSQACAFMATQALGALPFFACFPSGFGCAAWALPSIIGAAYYPWAKRHTRAPQLILGLFLSWGVFIGALVLDTRAFSIHETKWSWNLPLCYLFISCVLWTVIYDTVYAHLDLKADIELGVGSLAVLWQDHTKPYLWAALCLMSGCMSAVGFAGCLGISYFLFAVAGTFLSLASMISRVDLANPQSMGWWFSNGFWYTAGSIIAGLVVEYLRFSIPNL